MCFFTWIGATCSFFTCIITPEASERVGREIADRQMSTAAVLEDLNTDNMHRSFKQEWMITFFINVFIRSWCPSFCTLHKIAVATPCTLHTDGGVRCRV